LKVRSHIIKRILDLAATAITAPIWLPVLVTVALMVRAKIGTPVFFRQSRPGRNQKPFELIKFRTMNSARDAAGNLLPDSERLTGFGRWLRSTSLDELPELINVLRGEMSLVGPRPLLMQYLARYSPRQARRHEVLPGITGWAQVNGRNAISWERKFELDVWYVENGSLTLDLKILLLTLTRVFARHGISAPGEATAPEFMGGSATQK
jgi:lipopolysaccharide/colanic/teichoic acid biosynthesis glycosyltransferase